MKNRDVAKIILSTQPRANTQGLTGNHELRVFASHIF